MRHGERDGELAGEGLLELLDVEVLRENVLRVLLVEDHRAHDAQPQLLDLLVVVRGVDDEGSDELVALPVLRLVRAEAHAHGSLAQAEAEVEVPDLLRLLAQLEAVRAADVDVGARLDVVALRRLVGALALRRRLLLVQQQHRVRQVGDELVAHVHPEVLRVVLRDPVGPLHDARREVELRRQLEVELDLVLALREHALREVVQVRLQVHEPVNDLPRDVGLPVREDLGALLILHCLRRVFSL